MIPNRNMWWSAIYLNLDLHGLLTFQILYFGACHWYQVETVLGMVMITIISTSMQGNKPSSYSLEQIN
jgi:hypothetical protein